MHMRSRSAGGIATAALFALGLLTGAGCAFDLASPPDDNGPIDPPQEVPSPSVRIRFANLTDLAVLADVYVSTNGDLTPAAIFADENQLIDGVGLASSGVLVPNSSDEVDVACEPGMVVATTGGVFRDPDTGDDLGVGSQRILQEGLVFDCEAEITFVYRLEDSGYTVIVTLN